QGRARDMGLGSVDFNAALAAANRFSAQSMVTFGKETEVQGDLAALNRSLRAVEGDFLATDGLPGRPWFKHTIFAPGEYTGYAAVVIPGVNEAVDAHEPARAQAQMAGVTAALVRGTATLEEVQ